MIQLITPPIRIGDPPARSCDHEDGPECARCRTFVCMACYRRVSWGLGCSDDYPDICDDCWVLIHNGRAEDGRMEVR